MKQIIIYLILALRIPAAYCFTACDTDIEPIDQQIIKPDQQDPAQCAAYLAALKAYKASEHYIVYASLANAPAVPGSEKAFLRSLPDSLDIVALETAGNLTEYDIEDIPQAQAKCTKILYTVDYITLAESTDAATLGTYLDKVIDSAGSGLLLNVVTDPFLGYFRNRYIFGQEADLASTVAKITSGVTLINSLLSTVCAVVLLLALVPALRKANLLPAADKPE